MYTNYMNQKLLWKPVTDICERRRMLYIQKINRQEKTRNRKKHQFFSNSSKSPVPHWNFSSPGHFSKIK